MHLVSVIASAYVLVCTTAYLSNYWLSKSSDLKRLKAAETKDVHECKREKKIELKLSEVPCKKWFSTFFIFSPNLPEWDMLRSEAVVHYNGYFLNARVMMITDLLLYVITLCFEGWRVWNIF